jgi:hypothetical protein
MSGLAIALVISLESLYHDEGIPWIVTAVIGGSIVTELLVSRTTAPEQPLGRMERARTPPAGVPIPAAIEGLDAEHEREVVDELDDGESEPHDGPIYRDEPPSDG